MCLGDNGVHNLWRGDRCPRQPIAQIITATEMLDESFIIQAAVNAIAERLRAEEEINYLEWLNEWEGSR